jgi:putative SOS response-associated peptidase YedK
MKVSLTKPTQLMLKQRFAVQNQLPTMEQKEVLPGGWYPILRDSLSGKAEMFCWGISESRLSDEKRLVFALKIEDLFTSRGRHLLQRRAIVPVESFSLRQDGKVFNLGGANYEALALAAIWDIDGYWRGRPRHAFKIITGPTVEGLEQLGPRMPIVLNPNKERIWLWHFSEENEALDALEPNVNLRVEEKS